MPRIIGTVYRTTFLRIGPSVISILRVFVLSLMDLSFPREDTGPGGFDAEIFIMNTVYFCKSLF